MSKTFKSKSKPSAARVYALYHSLMRDNRRDFVVDDDRVTKVYVDRKSVIQTMMDTLGITENEVFELSHRGWHEKYGDDKLCHVALPGICWCWKEHMKNCRAGLAGCQHTFIDESGPLKV